jgi:hypothetical protein
MTSDNARQHMTNLTKATMAPMGWEITSHLLYIPALDPSDLHFFKSMKVHLRGLKFQTDDVFKSDVLNWLRCQHITFLVILACIEVC